MKFFNNFKKPQGKLGKTIINQMNDKNAQVAIWGINHFNINENDTILDIGCGGGTNLILMAKKAKSGKVYGADYSQLAVDEARELTKNIKNIEVIKGDVSKLPYEDNTFDKITAIKTVFFWPDLESNFKEVKRILKDDGIFVIIADFNGHANSFMKFSQKLMEMNAKSDIEITKILLKAGFSEVKTYIRDVKGKKETIKLNNVKQKTIDDTFNGEKSPSDKMDEWVTIISK